MVAWNRLYLNEVQESFEDATEAIQAAVQVGQKRAEMVARLTPLVPFARWVISTLRKRT